jgi:hypothetical protein
MNLKEQQLNDIKEVINQQFIHNRQTNIYHYDFETCFSNQTKMLVETFSTELFSLSDSEFRMISNYYIELFENQFYCINQYIYISDSNKQLIRNIFFSMFTDIAQQELENELVEKRHCNRIRKFIKITNPLIYQMHRNSGKDATAFICQEYSASFLLELLKLNINEMKSLVLDIGCGSNGYLVEFLRMKGIDAYGIDRDTKKDFLIQSDWFTYDYGILKWNTIISNLSFSSHFLHHHLNHSQLVNQYAHTYMKILNSLTIGGKWIYTPSIPFFEELLPRSQYKVLREKINDDFCRTIVSKGDFAQQT